MAWEDFLREKEEWHNLESIRKELGNFFGWVISLGWDL